MITWADVEAVAPELSTLPEATQLAILSFVGKQLSSEVWGDRLDLGLAYLAAHLGTISKRGGTGPGGVIASETVGPSSRSYAVAAAAPGALGSTLYGQEYQRLTQGLATCRGTVL
jgi:hypothetical protein